MASIPPVLDPNNPPPLPPFNLSQGFPTTIPPDGPSIIVPDPTNTPSTPDGEPREPDEGGEREDFPKAVEPVDIPEPIEQEPIVQNDAPDSGTVAANAGGTSDAGDPPDTGSGDSGAGDCGGGGDDGGPDS